VFIIGIGWEVFEQLLNTFVSHHHQIILDTISDIFFDGAGACFAILYVFKRNNV
jgi:hypothetical protein